MFGKKHVSQMSEEEREQLLNEVRGLGGWEITDYCFNRMIERLGFPVAYRQIKEVCRQGKLIEVHYKGDSKRVLMRGNFKIRFNRELVVALCLTTKQVITVWDNDESDMHETVDWKMYNLA